jgi:hypothetical protein
LQELQNSDSNISDLLIKFPSHPPLSPVQNASSPILQLLNSTQIVLVLVVVLVLDLISRE